MTTKIKLNRNTTRRQFTADELTVIALEHFQGRPPTFVGYEADQIRKSFDRQHKEAKEGGYLISINSEIPDFDKV